ncbi:hypothetical protein VTN00DRAFT_5215 [Thermoascus crustaceus]|uniref:uncharacterized protein n=1 Tax=Thermoascus crustaceus TaxID=5088 RepID=UPI003743E5FE
MRCDVFGPEIILCSRYDRIIIYGVIDPGLPEAEALFDGRWNAAIGIDGHVSTRKRGQCLQCVCVCVRTRGLILRCWCFFFDGLPKSGCYITVGSSRRLWTRIWLLSGQ